jgi:hypothetical protein
MILDMIDWIGAAVTSGASPLAIAKSVLILVIDVSICGDRRSYGAKSHGGKGRKIVEFFASRIKKSRSEDASSNLVFVVT